MTHTQYIHTLFMKKTFVFATNNAHKLEEVRAILSGIADVESLNEAGCAGDIDETGTTLEENALIKARHVYSLCGRDCFADDTGLEVEALNGAPGVHSARYANPDRHDPEANIRKLLHELEGKDNRRAQFRTVFALIADGKEHLFEGTVKGTIIPHRRGTGGFGYDSVFVPDGYNETFAEMGNEQKNRISHRAVAAEKLVHFLKK